MLLIGGSVRAQSFLTNGKGSFRVWSAKTRLERHAGGTRSGSGTWARHRDSCGVPVGHDGAPKRKHATQRRCPVRWCCSGSYFKIVRSLAANHTMSRRSRTGPRKDSLRRTGRETHRWYQSIPRPAPSARLRIAVPMRYNAAECARFSQSPILQISLLIISVFFLMMIRNSLSFLEWAWCCIPHHVRQCTKCRASDPWDY